MYVRTVSYVYNFQNVTLVFRCHDTVPYRTLNILFGYFWVLLSSMYDIDVGNNNVLMYRMLLSLASFTVSIMTLILIMYDLITIN